MSDFLIWYEHDQFQEFHQLIESVLTTVKPKNEPFGGLPKEMKRKYKNEPVMYQRYVKQRVRYINEREQQRQRFINWCSKKVIEQFTLSRGGAGTNCVGNHFWIESTIFRTL